MPKKMRRAGRTAAQKAASRKNLIAARKKKERQGNAIMNRSNVSPIEKLKAEMHYKKADALSAALWQKPQGKRANKKENKRKYGVNSRSGFGPGYSKGHRI